MELVDGKLTRQGGGGCSLNQVFPLIRAFNQLALQDIPTHTPLASTPPWYPVSFSFMHRTFIRGKGEAWKKGKLLHSLFSLKTKKKKQKKANEALISLATNKRAFPSSCECQDHETSLRHKNRSAKSHGHKPTDIGCPLIRSLEGERSATLCVSCIEERREEEKKEKTQHHKPQPSLLYQG